MRLRRSPRRRRAAAQVRTSQFRKPCAQYIRAPREIVRRGIRADRAPPGRQAGVADANAWEPPSRRPASEGALRCATSGFNPPQRRASSSRRLRSPQARRRASRAAGRCRSREGPGARLRCARAALTGPSTASVVRNAALGEGLGEIERIGPDAADRVGGHQAPCGRRAVH